MDYETFIYSIELIGIAVFATTGALAAQGKRLDMLGVVVLAIVTSLGGGTIRDVVLDIHPLVWIANTTYLWVAISSAVVAFIVCRYMQYPLQTLLILDAMGLAVFSILGAKTAMSLDLPAIIVVIMATITGCAGGMIRDLLTGQIPLILQRDGELYATCALAGSIIYFFIAPYASGQIAALLSMGFIFIFRLAAIFAHLTLPEFIVSGHELPNSKDKTK